LENDVTKPPKVVGSAPTLLTTHFGLKCSAAAVRSVRAVKAGPRSLKLGQLRAEVGVGGHVLLLGDDARGRDLGVEPSQAALSEIVILVEVADLLPGVGVGDVLARDLALDDVVGLPAECVRPLRRLVPAVTPGRHEQVGDL
jgi:hypothetical protein